jgi:soluble lytic murein transglycosylase-like protein
MAGRRRDISFLGGLWMLMAPPDPALQPGAKVTAEAPVSSWQRIASYPTAMECEQDRVDSLIAARKRKDRAATAMAACSRCFHVDQLRRVGVRYGGRLGMPRVDRTEYDDLIREAAELHRLEYALVKAVIRAESDFNRLAVSPKGARGLMQLMPATTKDHLVRNVFVPRENITAGCRHLRMLLDRYGGNLELALAAYNAGIRRVDASGVPRIAETQQYVDRVLRFRLAYQVESPRVARQARRP